MMVAIAKEPRMSDAAKAWCEGLPLSIEEIVKIEQRVMLERVSRLEISDTEVANWGHLIDEDDPGAAAALRALLERAVVELAEGRRDVTSVFINKTWWMVTGGLSWGDTPTDAYDLIVAVDGFRITERAMSLPEVEAAHATAAVAR
ncbi:hypothetical protein [Microbacterium maritypicum]